MAYPNLSISDDQLHNLVDGLPTLAWIIEPGGRITFCNRRGLEYTGCPLEVMAGNGWTPFVHPDDLRILSDVWLSSESLVERTVRIRRFNGQYKWFLVHLASIRDDGGSIRCWYGTCTDVDEFKQAEAFSSIARRTLENIARGDTLDNILKGLCDALDRQYPGAVTSIKLVDSEGNRLNHAAGGKVPRAWIEATNPTKVGLTTGPCGAAALYKRTVFVDDMATDPSCADVRDSALSNGLRAALSKPLLSKSNDVLGTVCAYFLDQTSNSGNWRRMIEEIADIALIAIERERSRTELTRDSEEIKTLNRRFREIFNSIPTQVWCAFDAYTTDFQNQRWLDYVGLPEEQTKGIGWSNAVHPDDADSYFKKWVEIVASGSGGQAEARFRRHDGEYRWFLMQAEPLRDDRGNIVKWYGANTDIEDLKRGDEALKIAQLELARAVRLTTIGEFATSIAHEVNQPLTAIVANANAALRWLTKDKPDLLETRLAAERIVENARRAGDIIRGIRGLAKKGTPEIIWFNLNEAIQEIIALIQGEFRAYDVALELDLLENVEPIKGNRVQIQQVVLNLIRNGLEAMHAVNSRRRILRVSSRIETQECIAIAVADSGVGIEPANIDRIFSAFFTTKPEGTGIGLSICRSILEAHGGRLWAAPNFPYGTILHIALPTAQPATSCEY